MTGLPLHVGTTYMAEMYAGDKENEVDGWIHT
jgi:hypothetical protein